MTDTMQSDSWMSAAACRGDTEVMYDAARRREARAMCEGCPVRSLCLWSTMAKEEDEEKRYGMAGGLSPHQRTALAQRLDAGAVTVAYAAAVAAREVQTSIPAGVYSVPNVVEPDYESVDVVAVVAASFRFSPDKLTGRSGDHRVVEARQTAMYVLRETQGLSYPAIGRALGGRDHSTVITGVRRTKEAMAIPGRRQKEVERAMAMVLAES